jgi:hypothetical protein
MDHHQAGITTAAHADGLYKALQIIGENFWIA